MGVKSDIKRSLGLLDALGADIDDVMHILKSALKTAESDKSSGVISTQYPQWMVDLSRGNSVLDPGVIDNQMRVIANSIAIKRLFPLDGQMFKSLLEHIDKWEIE